MSVHPIEYRYGRDAVKKIFEQENKIQRLLDVEAALARAHARVGNIPQKDAAVISRKSSTKIVKPSRVDEIEKKINHDIMAVVKALSEKCGGSGKYVHLGATSNDIIDTATGLLLKDYVKVLEGDLVKLKRVFLRLAKRHVNTVCIGRTHGQHALPTTYGLKFALYACEVQRHLDRLDEIKPRLLVGKMSGAVGTQAAFGDNGLRIQDSVMKDLGLDTVLVSTQVVQRDRHAEFMLLLALIAESLNKFATEVRNLQRTEIGEVAEGFKKKTQVGSSTMPHKMNPILAERICGISRVVKGNAFTSLENIPLWHERDLTNSSCERIIFPEACVLSDYILNLAIDLFSNLRFNKKNIERNLNLTQGRIMAEAVMIKLVEKGVGRQEAHELVRKIALESTVKDKPFREYLLGSKKIRELFTEKELDRTLDPAKYIGTAVKQVNRVLRKLG